MQFFKLSPPLSLLRIGFLAPLMVAMLATLAQAAFPLKAQEAEIGYEIDFSETQNHYLHVTARFETEKPETELMMATWAPGSYLIREYARHIDSMTVTDQAGNPVKFEKTKKNRWMLQTKDVQSVTLKYRLYCNEMTVRTNWTGNAYSMINGAPTFITPVGARQKTHSVKLNLPKRWKRSACALPTPNGPHEYLANSYDELVDNPIVAGNIQVYPFDVDGVPHQLINVGESGYWDGVKAAADLKKMVKAQQEIWDTVPYKKYLFINMIAEAGGGLEHDNCTLIMTSRWHFRDTEKYQNWLSLASHEFFHTWNVRRLRPKSLLQYDYENEMFTRSLWVAEGVTSYYEDLALARSGLITRQEYLERLSSTVEKVQAKPGRKVQSLTEASFDTWIKFYRPDENSNNTRVSYYAKGTVAAFLLDAKIRTVSEGKRSLDDVMRKMYEEYSESGYTQQDFRDTASEVTGVDLSQWFVKAIDSTEELDFSEIGVLGIEVADLASESSDSEPEVAEVKKEEADIETKDEDGDDQDVQSAKSDMTDQEGKPEVEPTQAESEVAEDEPSKPDPKPWIGVGGTAKGDSMIVSSVDPNSPAYQAGIQTDDELIAVNDFRLKGRISDRLEQFAIGEPLEILLSRRGQLLRIKVTSAAKTKFDWSLKFVKEPDSKQELSQDSWLGEVELTLDE